MGRGPERSPSIRLPDPLRWNLQKYWIAWETFIGHLLKGIFGILFPKRA
jgi:hypothetical protein